MRIVYLHVAQVCAGARAVCHPWQPARATPQLSGSPCRRRQVHWWIAAPTGHALAEGWNPTPGFCSKLECGATAGRILGAVIGLVVVYYTNKLQTLHLEY